MIIIADDAKLIADAFRAEHSLNIMKYSNEIIECLCVKIKQFATQGKYEFSFSVENLPSLGVDMPADFDDKVIKNVIQILENKYGYAVSLDKSTFFRRYIIKWK